MSTQARYQEILKILYKLKYVTVSSLTERLNVSEVTIRKDLSTLEAQGKVIRNHGGASLAEDTRPYHPINLRFQENIIVKRAIAQQARQLIKENDIIYIDAGSTCYYLAEAIKEMNLQVVTNSLDVMNILSHSANISLYNLGGSFRPEAASFIGPIAIKALQDFQIGTCFMGASGISSEGKFSSQNIIEALQKKSVIEASSRAIVLADSGKIGVTAFSIFAHASDIDILITDQTKQKLALIDGLDIEIMKAPGGKK